jgi:hypothetical protein
VGASRGGVERAWVDGELVEATGEAAADGAVIAGKVSAVVACVAASSQRVPSR